MKFKVHAEGIALEAKVRTKLWHRLEVQAEVAIVLTRYGDVLAVKHLRIALHAPRQRLDEGEVILVAELLAEHVATEHTGIAFAGLGIAVATQLGLQIHAEMRVVVPEFLIVLFHFYY